MIRIGLPKGTIKTKSLHVIRQLTGVDTPEKKLSYKNDVMEIFLLKHRDIPGLLSRNRIDIGVTSTEWLTECNCDLKVFKHLDWCDTRMSVIGKAGTQLHDLKQVRCVTEFPSIAANYFREQGIAQVDITAVSGSSESMVPSIFDISIDCVETGRTLRENGLIEIDIISHCKTVLVCRREKLTAMQESFVSRIN